MMSPIFDMMIKCVHQEEGAVQKLTGDGTLALFGAPLALEDAPARAAQAAMAIQAGMEGLSREIDERPRGTPRMPIGIHWGSVVISSMSTDMRMHIEVVGDTVNLAARLQAEAKPGGILLSETAYRDIAPYAECEFAGEREVRGKSEPHKVYDLKRLRRDTGRFAASLERGLTSLVGGERELDVLRQLLRQAAGGRLAVADIEELSISTTQVE